jgi:hypothetical protein
LEVLLVVVFLVLVLAVVVVSRGSERVSKSV